VQQRLELLDARLFPQLLLRDEAMRLAAMAGLFGADCSR